MPSSSDVLPPALFSTLRGLQWKRLRLNLRCIANREARRHPHFVLRAVLYCARSLAANPLRHLDLHWRPVSDWWGERLHRDHPYRLDVFLPNATDPEREAFAANLAAHLANPARGFALDGPVAITARTLATLEAEAAVLPAVDPAADELCLDFFTPLTFQRVDERRSWLLTPAELGRLFADRFEQLGVPRSDLESLPWHHLEILPAYWTIYPRAETHREAAASRKGEMVKGCRGPLYLRGPWQGFLPLFRLAQELQLETGDEARRGQGAFHLRTHRPFFDLALRNPDHLRFAWDQVFDNDDLPDGFADELLDRDAECAAIVQTMQAGAYQPAVVTGFFIEKQHSPAGTDRRLIVQLPARDRIVQRALHNLMAPVCDRLLEHASVAYRPGRSLATAHHLVREALQAGCTWALETDIAAFFDEIKWPQLEAALDRAIPRADTVIRTLLTRFVQQRLRLDGQLLARTKGILQGSPLSPLLANLYLDTFDEQVLALGHHFIRYGDDLLVLTHSEEAARAARDQVRELLVPLGLELKEEKTLLTPLASGLRFLGFEVPADLDTARVADVALRQTLFIQPDPAFVGLDNESLIVRRKQVQVGRLPLCRLGCLVLFGHHAISTGLLRACTQRRIPVVFCSSGGHYHATLRPDSRQHFEVAARQYARHQALGDAGRLGVARQIVAAKLAATAQWLRDTRLPDARPVIDALRAVGPRLHQAPNVETLRGHEGEAARRVFAWIQSRIGVPEFTSPARVPHAKPDRYNAVMDFAYWLLFSRMNVLVRGLGLSPYLGFLHSARDHYESLVYDLMEPFRCRLDRMVLNCLHLRSLKPEHLEQPAPDQPWRLAQPGMAVLVQAFERELATQRHGEPGTLRQLLVGQVNLVEIWALGEGAFRVYPLLGRTPPPSAPRTARPGPAVPAAAGLEASPTDQPPETPSAEVCGSWVAPEPTLSSASSASAAPPPTEVGAANQKSENSKTSLPEGSADGISEEVL